MTEAHYEPCGYRSHSTGALLTNLETVRKYGARNSKGKRMSKAEWEAWWPAEFEVIYRRVDTQLG